MNGTDDDVLGEVVEARLGWVGETVRSWYTESELRRQLGVAVSVDADRLGDVTFGAQFRDDLTAAGGGSGVSDPLAWANRRLELGEGGWAVTGIRFRGGDAMLPFVDLVATTVPPTPDGLAEVAEAVAPAYDAFHPLCLRVDAPDASTLVARLETDPRFGPRCRVDMHVVAGLVHRLHEQPRVPRHEEVTLRPGDPLLLSRRAAEIYEEITRARPEHAMWATPEDVDSLAECAEAGLLFEVLHREDPAGVVAAVRDDAHGMRGFSVQELCLDAAHRGQRLAPAVLQRLVDELPCDEGDVLWGTIDPANVASLRNALSIGRQPVGGYVWVTPAGLPGQPVAPNCSTRTTSADTPTSPSSRVAYDAKPTDPQT
jgi:hypothetical protein